MKKKLNQSSVIGMLIICVSLFFLGCQKDESIQQESNQNFSIKEVAFSQFQTNSKLVDKISTLKNPIGNQTNVANKNNSAETTYDINTNHAIYIEYGNGKHTYTFTVTNTNGSASLENIVLSLQDDGSYKAYLTTYNLTQQELDDLNNGIEINTSMENSSMQEIDNSQVNMYARTTCRFEMAIIEVEHACEIDGCWDPQYTTIEYVNTWVKVCTDDGNGGSIGGDDGDGSVDDGTGGCAGCDGVATKPKGTGLSDDGSIDLEPLNVDGILWECFGYGSLAYTRAQLLDDVQRTDIANFINTYGCSAENSEFAKEAVNVMIDDGEVDFEEKIINGLEGKALCVYNKLKSSSTGFKNAIKKFEPEFPVAHLKFDMGDIGASKGRTIAPNSNPTTPNSPDFVITVRLNNNDTSSGVTKRPNLLVVKTIAHEVIHAEMFRKLLSVLDNGGNITGVTRQDVLDALDGNFPGMYDYFMRHKNWQHQQMATHYREALARILQEYDTGLAVPDNQQPAQLYMDLSWEGLIYENGDNAIYTWTSLPEDEKERIEGVISTYIEDNLNENCSE